MSWEKLQAVDPHGSGCLHCPDPKKFADLEKCIAVGFGAAVLTRDGRLIYDGEDAIRRDEELWTFADAEARAVLDPDHDWQIQLHGPLHGETYQRQGDSQWVCVESNRGFAQFVTLHRLLTLSLISRYDQYTWFRDCTLEKTIILCPSKELAASLTRCWLPQIQRVLPDCTVRVGTAPPSAKTVYRGQISSPYQARLEDQNYQVAIS